MSTNTMRLHGSCQKVLHSSPALTTHTSFLSKSDGLSIFISQAENHCLVRRVPIHQVHQPFTGSPYNMDIHDVSQMEEYLPILQKHKQSLRNAQSRQGQTLKPTRSRDEIIMEFMFRRMMNSNRPTNTHDIHSSFVPPAYPPSVAALSTLKRILIRDITLETYHRGFYILLRAVTPMDRMTAVMTVVEDERGDVVMLQLYNQEKELSTDGRLVEGTVILVKEPYLKVMADGNYGMRADHLSDIRFLPGHDSLIPLAWGGQRAMDASANNYKIRGNNCFNKNEHHLAINQ